MNIFKMLASGGKSLKEEHLSTIICWFLNPKMEHGLGYSFLVLFLDELRDKGIFHTDPNVDNGFIENEIKKLSNNLAPKFREDSSTDNEISCHLELSLFTSDEKYIRADIVLEINEWVLCIENKIYAESASNVNQLKEQYDGLKKMLIARTKKENNDNERKKEEKKKIKEKMIGMIFLVPIDNNGTLSGKINEDLHSNINNEFKPLQVEKKDFKVLYTWHSNSKYPSVSNVITKLLTQESLGEIEPISEYVKHTLKAFKCFIENDFQGYDFESRGSSGSNPLTEEVLSLPAILKKDKGFVGISRGVAGLISISPEERDSRGYQFTTNPEIKGRRNWMTLDKFKKLIGWLEDRKKEKIYWEEGLKLPYDVLLKIAESFGNEIYIGIQGGAEALKRIKKDEADTIKNKSWGIANSPKTSQWIDGETFAEIVKDALGDE